MDVTPQIDNNSFEMPAEQLWQEHIKLKQQSGLSRAAYCRLHNLVCSRFTYWENKLSQPLSKLLPVRLVQSSAKQHVLCSLMFKNGNELRIHDPAILPTLISSLS